MTEDVTPSPASGGNPLDEITAAAQQLKDQVRRVIVGQDEVIEQLFICLFTRSHALLVGVPGLAKTLLVSTVAKTMSLEFNRIQFTPDLMPSDITGTEVIDEDKATGVRSLRFVRGPVFANVILADEINRTPPKTQAALLEAMQERQVSYGGNDMALPNPFFVLATQNPIEQEGTYPLPEAQLDRFMFQIKVGYPTASNELEIVRRTTSRGGEEAQAVLDADTVLRVQQLVRDVPVADHVINYALRLVRATRPPARGVDDLRPEFCQKYLNWGAGPRASQNLVLAAKAHAVMYGRSHATTEDIAAVAGPVLRHRLVVNFAAEADGIDTDHIVEELIAATPTEGPADPQAELVLR